MSIMVNMYTKLPGDVLGTLTSKCYYGNWVLAVWVQYAIFDVGLYDLRGYRGSDKRLAPGRCCMVLKGKLGYDICCLVQSFISTVEPTRPYLKARMSQLLRLHMDLGLHTLDRRIVRDTEPVLKRLRRI